MRFKRNTFISMVPALFVLICLIAVSGLAASPASAQQHNQQRQANAPAAQPEWQAPGATMAALKFGPGADQVGCVDEKTALYDFISPTSVFYKNGALFILDAPNFRLNKYTAKAPGKPFTFDSAIKLYKKPASDPAETAAENAPAAPLFTDLAVLDNGTIFVASSREKLIYRYDASGALTGKISPRIKLDGITRIWADSEKKLLIEDPFAGKIFVINHAGELIYELDLNFQPVLLPSGETVRVEYPETPDSSREINVKIFKIPAKFESASIKAVFHMPVQNFIALGSDASGSSLYAYVVLGPFNDAPAEAWFVSIDLSSGAVTAKTPAPISPEMSCMRYVRMTGVEGSFIFARSNEDEYLVTKHSLVASR
ncbi:MAG: hypothetical protein A2008_04730 [Candidatus Wallbacteria bacterium GWC2_49_35]|uniref:SMP-30/Gluconolactonase/LRE-like region domain-containing protein n=1 Tax=Candidatus Wallbacteria bacterium GWC2_49_35 TaxID=1817813 RepID=A0A1F7WNB1_9BACT|nr:MAG: hypothetical protein A2008_04730 [Candidatus Wallbacteria bacterium GWC2_49_35]